jgi:hypothetical protein
MNSRMKPVQDVCGKMSKSLCYPHQAWREDRTLIAAVDCIADVLGHKYVESIPLSMEKTWIESSHRIPIICLLSPGE